MTDTFTNILTLKGRAMQIHLVRQGDVLLFPATESVKAGKKIRREKGLVILARGEATGHHHSFAEKGVELFETDIEGDQLLVIEADGAVLRHQEHAPIAVPKGRYVRRIQREYKAGELPVSVRD